MANLETNTDQTPFNRLERNIVSFKGLFNVLNSTSFNASFTDELFSKSFNIYNEDILSDPVDTASTVQQLGYDRTKSWTITGGKPSANGGQISSGLTSPAGSSNSNVEKIIISNNTFVSSTINFSK